jgi:hypothetical protein
VVVDGIPVVGLTAPALLGLAILLLLTGRLIPRRTYDDLKQDREDWKAAHRESERIRGELVQHMNMMVEQAKVTEALLRSLGAHADPPKEL